MTMTMLCKICGKARSYECDPNNLSRQMHLAKLRRKGILCRSCIEKKLEEVDELLKKRFQ